jgi:aspartyl protease family protein
MGIFRVRVRVFNVRDEKHSREIELVVDTGATFPVVPQELASELGIQVSESRTFTLADGTEIRREMGWAGLAYDGRQTPTLVVLGEPGDVPILGAIALEGLGLEIDAAAKRLRPGSQYLLATPSLRTDRGPMATEEPIPGPKV